MRAAAIAIAIMVAALGSACSLVVDVGDLRDGAVEADGADGVSPDVDVPADDSVEPDADSGGDADAADADGDADADDDGSVDDARPDTDGDVEPDAEADHATDADVVDGADADADVVDGADADGDADADTADDADADGDSPTDSDADGTTVGPPALVFGEMTSSGAPAASTGCVASGTGFCLRSDTLDPGAVELTGGAFRLRGIVVGGGAP
jgi:hypothetical protein